jgi:CotH kinase protein
MRACRSLIFSSVFLGLLSGCGASSVLQVTTTTPSIVLFPDNVSMQAITVSVANPGSPYEPISIKLQDLPAGVTSSSSTLSLISDGQASFVLKASTTAGGPAFAAQGAAQVSFPVVIQATAGTKQASANVNLTITSQNPNFVPTTTNLPVLDITTDNAAPIVSTTDYVSGSMSIAPLASSTDPVFSGTMEIKGHGNTTWALPKKPYKVKLDSKASLLGMPAGKDWVLLANYDDKSLLRDQVAFEVSRRVDLAWTPNSQFVELYLNGQYQGNYQLTEEIKIDKHRVNIPEMDDTDISGKSLTGGYLLEVDTRGDPDDILFKTSRGVLFDLHDPDPDAPQQLTYIQNYMQQAEDALYSADFTDSATGYPKYLDQDSFIDWYLVNELFKNNDAVFWSSCWLYKDRSGKIFMGPAWDFDIGAGNINYNGNDDPTGWWLRSNPLPFTQWTKRLFDDPAFAAAVAARWKQLKTAQLDTLPVYIDENAAALSQSQENNFRRWPILGQYVFPNAEVAGSYQGEVSYLKSWLAQRIAWMDSQLDPEHQGSGMAK